MGAIPLKAVTNRFPQVGGNRTSEAPGVIFDPTTGGEGMETPLPNDSLKASLNSPVGGHLHSFRRDWQTNKCSSNVLNLITNGYVLPCLSRPNLVRFPLILSEYKARQKDQALATCIQSLLSKNAIERVETVKSLGFYRRLFLVHLPPFRTSHTPPGLYNDCKGSETNGPLLRTQTLPVPGRLSDQVPVSGGSPSEHSGSGRANPVLGLDNKSGKIKTETYSGVFVRGL